MIGNFIQDKYLKLNEAWLAIEDAYNALSITIYIDIEVHGYFRSSRVEVLAKEVRH